MIIDYSEFFKSLHWFNTNGGAMAKTNLKLSFQMEKREHVRRHLEKYYGSVIAA